tara:strand:+ start:138 stop:392 length:255 start_codon:yes stop_codon:yes gene_type:complete
MQCVICKFPITGYGHNADPVAEGKCCDICNFGKVIPARVEAMNAIIEDDEPEMPEGGWECSECGNPVKNMNDYCSQSCFNAGMR